MKWFKHMSFAHSDDKLVRTRTEFGMWGIGVYWTLLEMVAAQMKGKVLRPVATFDMWELCSFFECKRNKLETFLKHLRNVYGMKVKRSKDVIEIEIGKLTEIKDNYHDDLEETSRKLPSIDRELDSDSDVYKDIGDQWNTFAVKNGLSKIIGVSDKRKRGIRARLKEPAFHLNQIFDEIEHSEFLRGLKDGKWKVDFDFVFCSGNNYLKILERKYRDKELPLDSLPVKSQTYQFPQR